MKIKDCGGCDFCKSERVYTSDSWEHVEKWTCGLKKKVVVSYHEPFDKDPIPKWCPLREIKSIKLIKD